MVNKYEQKAEIEIDLHGCTTSETKEILDELIEEGKYKIIRVITGKGTRSVNGPILPTFVKAYLNAKNIRYNPAKIANGGEGALEVFLK